MTKILTNSAISPPWQNPWLTMLSHCHDKTTDSLWYLTVMTKPYLSLQNPNCAISLSWQIHIYHYKTLTVLSHCQDKNPDSLCYLTVMTKPYLSVQNPNCAVSPPRQKKQDSLCCLTGVTKTWPTVLSHCPYKNLTHCAISQPWQKPDSLCYLTALTKTWLTFSWPCWGRMGWRGRGWQLTLIQDPAQGPQHHWPHHGECGGFAARCPDPLHCRRCPSRWLARHWNPQTSLWDKRKWCALKLCVRGMAQGCS